MNDKLTRDEFLEKLKTDKNFNNNFGRKDVTNGKQVLPPCHYGFQCYTRELSFKEQETLSFRNPPIIEWDDLIENDKREIPTRALSLKWTQRSVDTFLGFPFNIASYGLLLQILAQHVNMVPDELIGSLGDTHLYSNHIDQAKTQIGREGFVLPTVKIRHFDKIEELTFEHFELIGYESHPRIKAPLSN